ncbi:hypothetical protein AQPW35_53030 [Rubrivivax pictus]|uniref:Uncharacterized protein n=1 Tax=Pseudaquabacterium pictum TaxID=2315236 RepID=A0A480B0W6_9BURK|nr:hypothetical protein AQPW35_53030 [Rubrivivax pictus]
MVTSLPAAWARGAASMAAAASAARVVRGGNICFSNKDQAVDGAMVRRGTGRPLTERKAPTHFARMEQACGAMAQRPGHPAIRHGVAGLWRAKQAHSERLFGSIRKLFVNPLVRGVLPSLPVHRP